VIKNVSHHSGLKQIHGNSEGRIAMGKQISKISAFQTCLGSILAAQKYTKANKK